MSKYIVLFFIFIGTCSYAQNNTPNKSSQQKFIINENLSNTIFLHPNPVGEFLKIKSENLAITKIEIFSILGGKVKEINSKYKSIYLGDLPRGIYLIKIYSKEGYTVKKLIKK